MLRRSPTSTTGCAVVIYYFAAHEQRVFLSAQAAKALVAGSTCCLGVPLWRSLSDRWRVGYRETNVMRWCFQTGRLASICGARSYGFA